MREKRGSSQAKYGEETKVIRLPITLANFLQQYPSVITELVSQINDGAIILNVDVTGCNTVTSPPLLDIHSMIEKAIAACKEELREDLVATKNELREFIINSTTSILALPTNTNGGMSEPVVVLSIEKALPDEILDEPISESDDSTALIKLPVKEVVAIATVETSNDKTGMNTQEAFLIAQQRGYKGNSKSFRDRFNKQNMAKDFGLRRIPHDGGREKWLYFDTRSKTQS